MRLGLSEEQELLRDTFAELFASESSPERVRAAEPLGFDPALWKTLVETGTPGLRVPEAQGGAGAGLLEAAIVAEQAGRYLASGPILESVVACGLLAKCDSDAARGVLNDALDGAALVSFAPRPVGDVALVPGGAVADFVVALRGDALVLAARSGEPGAPANLGASPVARWSFEGAESLDPNGAAAFEAALEEWKLLVAAALGGLARRAIEIAAAYATERIQFDRPIGAFQGIAHPLANSVTDVEGAQLLVRRAIWAIAKGEPEAPALPAMCFAWAARAATDAVACALHTHGGYGLSLEYDIQLYHRRGKAWALCAGDPRDEFVRAAERLYGDAPVELPDPGEVTIDWSLGERARKAGERARQFFAEHLTPELRADYDYTWDGHDWAFQRKLAEHGLLFPSWPSEYGGLDADPYETAAIVEEFGRAPWTMHAIGTTRMVAESVMQFATEDLKQEVLPRVAGGEVICCLGYSEPSSGSDVAAAQTRAVRDGDGWLINGQKMFTSGAHLCQYVFLLTRTDPDARKHQGLTMFLVPLDTPGIEVQPIYTLSDERTNATYYTDVRIPDRYRIGEVNGGWRVLNYALEMEHGGGGLGAAGQHHLDLAHGAADWARRTPRGGGRAFDDVRVRERVGFVATRAHVARVLGLRSLWRGVEGLPNRGEGPMYALFSADAYIEDAADLMDLCAPDSILKNGDPDAVAGGEVELAYRLSTAMSIYGGSSEIMRSIVAQVALEMPRSRS